MSGTLDARRPDGRRRVERTVPGRGTWSAIVDRLDRRRSAARRWLDACSPRAGLGTVVVIAAVVHHVVTEADEVRRSWGPPAPSWSPPARAAGELSTRRTPCSSAARRFVPDGAAARPVDGRRADVTSSGRRGRHRVAPSVATGCRGGRCPGLPGRPSVSPWRPVTSDRRWLGATASTSTGLDTGPRTRGPTAASTSGRRRPVRR